MDLEIHNKYSNSICGPSVTPMPVRIANHENQRVRDSVTGGQTQAVLGSMEHIDSFL